MTTIAPGQLRATLEEISPRYWRALAATNSESLRRLASALGLPAGDKPELLARFSLVLTDETFLRKQLDLLPQESRQLLRLACSLPGETTGPSRLALWSRLTRQADFAVASAPLFKRGFLLFEPGSESAAFSGEVKSTAFSGTLLLPETLRAMMAAPLESLLLLPDPGSAPETQRRQLCPAFFLRGVELLLSALAAKPLELTRGGFIKANGPKGLARQLAPLWPALGIAAIERLLKLFTLCGLAETDASWLRLTARGEALLRQRAETQCAVLLSGFLSPHFDPQSLEYFQSLVRDVREQNPQALEGRVFDIRADWPLMGDFLLALSEERWVGVDDLIECALADWPGLFFRAAGSSPLVAVPPLGQAPRLAQSFLAGFIEEIAYPLGLVEWAIGPKLKLLLRRTAFGRAVLAECLGATAGEQLPESAAPAGWETRHAVPALVVQPDFEVILFEDRLPLRDLQAVLRVTTPDVNETGLGPVWRLKLTRAATDAARLGGLGYTDLITVLERLGMQALPANVRAELGEWFKLGRLATLWRGYDLLEFRTSGEAQAAALRLPECVGVDGRFLLIGEGLGGQRPLIDYLDTYPTSLRAFADGHLERVPHSPADLGLLPLLAGVAEQDDVLNWWLLDERVRAFPGGAPALLSALGARTEFLPLAFEARLLAIGGALQPLAAHLCHVIDVADERLFWSIVTSAETRSLLAFAANGRTLGVAPADYAEFAAQMSARHIPLRNGDESGRPIPKARQNELFGKDDLAGFKLLAAGALETMLGRVAQEGQPIELLVWDRQGRKPNEKPLIQRVVPLEIRPSKQGLCLLAREENGRLRHEWPLSAILAWRPA